MIRIGSDIDDCLCNFWDPYIDRFGYPKKDKSEITKNVNQILVKDRDFWMNLPVITKVNFDITLYCTKRVHPKSWTKQYLEINGFPKAPVYQVYCQVASKAPMIKGRVDVFIEDSISNFIDLNSKGIPCLLIDRPHNQSWGAIGRIYELDKDEIEDSYHLFKKTIFPYFKELCKHEKNIYS